MLTELIASVVANGTTAWTWGYEPWLPFYNFFPIVIVVSLALSWGLAFVSGLSVTRSLLWGMTVLTSMVSAVVVVWALWLKLDLSPSEVFGWWVINTALMLGGQGYLILTNEKTKQRIKEMEEREI